jgi:16S rRNA processing protein RimM
VIALGRIRKPHGIHGEASVEAWTDSVDRFSDVPNVTLVSPDEKSTRAITIEAARNHSGRALLKFAGVETPEEIDDLRGWTIEIPDEAARKLDDDEYFLHDLVGLELVDANGEKKGVVTDAYEGGGGVLLDVKDRGRRYQVPFANEICTKIDLKAKRIVVNLPDGLDDLSS